MACFLSQIEREIRKLTKERASLDRRISKLEAVRSEYLRDQPHENLSRPRAEIDSGDRVKKIISILQESGKPLHYKEIVERLEQMGAETFEGVKNKNNTTTATLSLHRDIFKRVGKGTYALVESYEFPEPDVDNKS